MADATVDEQSCPDDDTLAAYVDHTAPAEERTRVEAHVDTCDACREALGIVASAATPPGPRMIDRYRLDAKLGAGGMGVVWKAWDPALERPIAIKLLHPDLDDRDARDRALREARALARLHHPNVLAIYDVGEHDGDVFIATELIDGASMDRWQVGKSPAEIIAAYAQAARGLAAAHALGLVHRDVKPSNILVEKTGRVAVGDFGLATSAARSSVQYAPRTRDAGPLPKLTADGAVLGTPAYMAPEQHDRSEVDARADQYSLCLALAESLLGKMPPADATAATLAASGIAAPWDAIARGLSERPQDRFPRIEDLLSALEPAPRRSRAGWLFAALAAIVLVGSIAAWQLTRETPAAAPRTPTPPPTVVPATPAPSWYWVAGATGPWQLPGSTRSLAVFDDQHAVALGALGFAILDLQTGAVTNVPFADGDPANVEELVRIGTRVLAFGDDGNGVPAAWELSIAPARLTPVPIPDIATPTTDSYDDGPLPGAIVSPDGRFVVVCSRQRPALLRDATTLAIVRSLAEASCNNAHFSDARHLVVLDAKGDLSIDITTDTHTRLKNTAPTVFQGPGTWTVTEVDNHVTVRDGTRVVRGFESPAWHLSDVQWTPGHTHAVALFGDSLRIYPLADDDAEPIEVALPSALPQIAVSATKVIAVGERSVVTVDLATGRTFKPERNLASVSEVAPRGRSVIASSDELRVWQEGKLVGRTATAQQLAVGAATAPIVLLTLDGLELWNPDTDERTKLRSVRSLFGVLARDGDAVALSERDRLLRGDIKTTLTPWHALKPDLDVRALDVRNERLAVNAAGATHIVDLRARSVWSLYLSEYDGSCAEARTIRFAADPTVFGIDGADVLVASSRTKTVRRLGSDESWAEWTFLPDGGLAVATETKVLIVDPSASTAIGWDTPIQERPMSIGVDPLGTAVAVGYIDGSVVWVDIAGLRAHGHPVAVTNEPASLCAPPPPQRSYDSLVAD